MNKGSEVRRVRADAIDDCVCFALSDLLTCFQSGKSIW